MEKTFHGKLVAKQNGIYTIYVFELDNSEFIMCTKLPNWTDLDIQLGDSGFITITEAIAGESYYDRYSESYKTYRFSNIYYKNFILDNKHLDDIKL